MNLDTKTPQNVLAVCREQDLRIVELRFVDFHGRFQRIIVPVNRLAESVFEDGILLDRALLSSWQVPYTPLVLVPLADSAVIDRWGTVPTIMLLCVIQDAVTREDWEMDPRVIAEKTWHYCVSTGSADQVLMSTALEFRLQRQPGERTQAPPMRPVVEAIADAGFDTLCDNETQRSIAIGCSSDELCDQITERLMRCGVPVDCLYAPYGDARWLTLRILPDTLVRAADWVVLAKHLIRSTAERWHWSASFASSTTPCGQRSGLTPALRLLRGSEALFAGTGNQASNDVGQHARSGVLHHRNSLAALAGFSNQVPQSGVAESSAPGCGQLQAVELRLNPADGLQPSLVLDRLDPSANPYLAYSAIVLAALDGMQNKYGSGGDARFLENQATTFAEALNYLEQEHEYLVRGESFTPAMIQTWVASQHRL